MLKSPSFSHLAGTDQFGRDEFSLVLEGLYVSLKIAGLAVLIAGVIGTVAGIVAGYLGHWTSVVIMRLTDMLFAIPAIVLALAIVTALGRLVEQRPGHRHRVHPDLRPGRTRPGAVASAGRVRTSRTGTRLFTLPPAVPPHPAEHRRHRNGAGQPGSRLGGPG